MIKLLRLDERLVHGQVATKMLVSLDIDTLVVVDDATANNKMSTQAIMMAVMGTGKGDKIKTSVKTIDVAVRLLNDPRCEPKKIFIVTRQLEDLVRIAREVEAVKTVNLGNYGSMAEDALERHMLSKGIRFSDDEFDLVRELLSLDIDVYAQMTPDGPKVTKQELIDRLNNSDFQ